MTNVADLRSILGLAGFRRLFASRVIAQSSDGIFQVALASYVFFTPERQATAQDAAIAFTVILLPYSIVGPFAGVLIDRWRRRQILVYANLIRTFMVVGVAAIVASDLPDPVLYGSALAVIGVNRFFLTGLSAALPHVVPQDKLVMANSVSTTSGAIAAIIGAVVGLTVRGLIGEGDDATALTMLVSAVTYIWSAVVARRFSRDALGPDFDPNRPQTLEAVRRVARGLIDGAHHIWVRRRAARALGTIAMHRLAYGVLTISAFLLYRNYFYENADSGLGGLAVALLATGIGIVSAAAITPPAVARLGKDGWIVACLLIAGVSQVLLVAPYVEPLLVAAGFVLGLTSQGTKICVDTIVQEAVDDAYRGRVFSVYDMIYNIAFLASAAAAAFVLPDSGRSYAAVIVLALGYLLTAAAYARTTFGMRGTLRR